MSSDIAVAFIQNMLTSSSFHFQLQGSGGAIQMFGGVTRFGECAFINNVAVSIEHEREPFAPDELNRFVHILRQRATAERCTFKTEPLRLMVAYFKAIKQKM